MSESSFGSAGSERDPALQNGRPDAEPEFDRANQITTGLFGVLYTVSKEKRTMPVFFVALKLFMDFLQLFLIMVNPAWGWDIDGGANWWKVVSFIQLNNFMMARGYIFFLVVMYIMVALLLANISLSFWVAWSFQSNQFDHVWPIVVLRLYATIFFNVFDIASLSLFLITLDCQYFDTDNTYYNQEFPEVMCWSMPHVIHVVIAAASTMGFVILACALLFGEMELNPLSRHILAIAHSKVEVVGFLLKVLMTCTTTFVTNLKWMCIILVSASTTLLWLYWRWMPFINSNANMLRVGSYTAVTYCAFLLVLMRFVPGIDAAQDNAVDTYRSGLTLAMWYGLAPTFVLGCVAARVKLYYMTVVVPRRLRSMRTGLHPKYIFRFQDPRDVEIVSRCVRHWIDEDNLVPEAVKDAEMVIKAGCSMLSNNCFMTILHSSFLIEVQGSYQTGYTQLINAKKQNPSVLEKFAIFSREQEHTQKESGAAGAVGHNSNVDLVSYVEFQRNHRLVMRMHKEALYSIRHFWQSLMHSKVTFANLSRAITQIEVHVRQAERIYRMVLEKHANNSRLLRLYGQFLQDVKNDPWSAAKWFSEAEKIEADEEISREKDAFGISLPVDSLGFSKLNDQVAVILVNAHSEIQMANRAFHQLLGFKKSELKGKNLSICVPPPFHEQHASYVRSYIVNGKKSILDQTSDGIAMHKDRSVFPVKLTVHQISGIGEDSIFMGIMEQQDPTPMHAKAWILSNGSIASVDNTFTDWFGHKAMELVGASLDQIFVDAHKLESALSRARNHRPKQSRSDAARRLSCLVLKTERSSLDSAVDAASLRGPAPTEGADSVKQSLLGRAISNFLNPKTPQQGPAVRVVPTLSEPNGGLVMQSGTGGRNTRFHESGNEYSGQSQDARKASLQKSSWAPTHQSDSAGGGMSIRGGSTPHSRWDDMRAQSMKALHAHMEKRIIDGEDSQHQLQQHWGGEKAIFSRDVQVRHKFGCLCDINVTLRVGAIGSQYFHELTFEHLDAPLDLQPTRYMFVCDRRGRLVHVTQEIAKLLNTTPAALQGGNSTHMLDVLIPQPWAQMHHAWVNDALPHTIPLRSCRSNRSVCLQTAATADKASELIPFKLHIQRRGQTVADQVSVVILQQRTLEEALDERRLKLKVNAQGVVESVSDADSKLFNCSPHHFVGRHVSTFVDVLRGDNKPLQSAPAAFSNTTGVLLELAQRSIEQPGSSWRVGVSLPIDQPDMQSLGSLGGAMLLKQTVPAVLVVRPVFSQAQQPTEATCPQPWAIAAQANPDRGSGTRTEASLAGWDGPTAGDLIADSNPVPDPAGATPGKPPKSALKGTARISVDRPTGQRADKRKSDGFDVPAPLLLAAAARGMAGSPTLAAGGFLDTNDVTSMAESQMFSTGSQRTLKEWLASLDFEIELWRADMMTGVVELDHTGHVVPGGADVDHLSPPGLLFGMPNGSLEGLHMSSFLPVPATFPIHEMFKELPMALSKKAAEAHKTTPRTNMKSRTPRGQVGEMNILKCHHQDGLSVQLEVTAVRKAAGTGLFLVLHPTAAKLGRRDFTEWLASTHEARRAAAEEALAHRGSEEETGAPQGTVGMQFALVMRMAAKAARLKLDRQATNKEVRRTKDGGKEHSPTQIGPFVKSMAPPVPPEVQGPAGLEMPDRVMTPKQGTRGARPSNPTPGAVPRLVLPTTPTAAGVRAPDALTTARDVALDVTTPRQPGTTAADPSQTVPKGRWGSGGGGGNRDSVSRTAAWVMSEGRVDELAAVPATVPGAAEDFGFSPGPGQTLDTEAAGPGPLDSLGSENHEDGSEEGGGSSTMPETDDVEAGGDKQESNREGKDKSAGHDHHHDGGFDDGVGEEAGAMYADYKRGKRFRKLCKLLGTTQSLRVLRRFHAHALACIAFLFIARAVAFTMMLVLLGQMQAEITDLAAVGLASKRVHEILIRTTYNGLMYANITVPGLRRFDNQTQGLTSSITDLSGALDSLRALHHGTYYGFRESREIPHKFGLWDLWNVPSLNTTDILSTTPTVTARYVLLSLWELGNQYLTHGGTFLQNAEKWNASGLNPAVSPDARWIQANGLTVLWGGYFDTLTAFVDLTVQDNKRMNNVHIVIICIEGFLLSAFSVIYMWKMAQAVSNQRYNMYLVFMSIPTGLIRSLAVKQVKLAEEDADDEDEGPEVAQGDAVPPHALGGLDDFPPAAHDGEAQGDEWTIRAGNTATFATPPPPAHTKLQRSVSILECPDPGAATAGSPLDSDIRVGQARGALGTPTGVGGQYRSSVDHWLDPVFTPRKAMATMPERSGESVLSGRQHELGKLPGFKNPNLVVQPQVSFLRRLSTMLSSALGTAYDQHSERNAKRILQRSYNSTIWMVWPFLAWGLVVITLNALRYKDVQNIEPSIALLNVINCVIVRSHRVIYDTLALAVFNTVPGADPTYLPNSPDNQNPQYGALSQELQLFQTEVTAMLYGNKFLNVTDPDLMLHFHHVTRGVGTTSSTTTDLLYQVDQACMCEDPNDCLAPSEPYFEVTNHGLGPLISAFITAIQTMLNSTGHSANLFHPSFHFLWTVAESDLEGGLLTLTQTYQELLQALYRSTITNHTIQFAMSVVLAAVYYLFLLRPFIQENRGEAKRIAELLAQLPPEMDVEGIVTRTLLPHAAVQPETSSKPPANSKPNRMASRRRA